MSTVLALEQVVREYRTPARKQRVLDRVSFSLEERDFVAITGPSGSGKSTLLNLCALLDRPDAGTVFLEGRSMTGLDEAKVARIRGRKIGVVLQNYALLPYRSVLENVMFRFRYVGAPDGDGGLERARRWIGEMGLSALADQPARLLSGGEMQRVAIARAVVLTPRILLADEPTGNLDADSADAVMDCFKRLNHEHGITVLLVTHNLTLLDACNRRVVCRDGRLEEAA